MAAVIKMITLTGADAFDAKKVTVSADRILIMWTNDHGNTVIQFGNCESIHVKESPEEICKMIREGEDLVSGKRF